MFSQVRKWPYICGCVYLAVGDGVKLFSDLVGEDNAVLGRGQRVGGGQGIDGKHPVDVIQNYQVFLGWGSQRERERERERERAREC